MIVRNIPNLITTVNLAMGCAAIIAAFSGRPLLVPVFLFIGFFADFIDGFVARLLKVSSPMGKELDSLADMVSFGLLPGVLMFLVLLASLQGVPLQEIDLSDIRPMAYLGFVITIFSAWRLAKFNIEESTTNIFRGMPTPSNTGFVVCMYWLAATGNSYFVDHMNSFAFIAVVIGFCSWILVSNLPMISNKFEGFKWQDNKERYILIGFFVLSVLFFHILGLALTYVFYIFLSLISFIRNHEKFSRRN